MKCVVCENAVQAVFNAVVLDKYDVSYYKCLNCGFLFTQDPFWLKEAYSSAIANADTGLVRRSLVSSFHVPIILHGMGLDVSTGKFLDYAGGGGILVRLLRDFGLDFYWNDKYCVNWIANGFEGSLLEQYTAITSFESFEHFVSPLDEISKLLEASDTIIFSTELISEEVPDTDWWYYSFETGQHIAFYNSKTFHYIAKKFKADYYNFNNVHILTKKPISLFRQKLIGFFIKKRALNFMCGLIYYSWIKFRKKLTSRITSDNQCMLKIKYKGI